MKAQVLQMNAEQQAAIHKISRRENVILSGRSNRGKRTACQQVALSSPNIKLHFLTDKNASEVRGKAAETTLVIDSKKFSNGEHVLRLLNIIRSPDLHSTEPFGGFRIVVIHDEDFALPMNMFCDEIARVDPCCARISFHENFHVDPNSCQMLNFLDGKCDDVPPLWPTGLAMYEDHGKRRPIVFPLNAAATRLNMISNAVAINRSNGQFQVYEALANSSSRIFEWSPTYILQNPEGSSTAQELREGLVNTHLFQSIAFVVFPWVSGDGIERLAFRVIKKDERKVEAALTIFDKCGWKIVDEIRRESQMLDCIPMKPWTIRLAPGSIVSYKQMVEDKPSLSYIRLGTVETFERAASRITGWSEQTLWPRVRFWDDNSDKLILPELVASNTDLHYKTMYAAVPLQLSFAIPFRRYSDLPHGTKLRLNPQWYLDEPRKLRYLVAKTPSWKGLGFVGGAPPYALLRRRLASLL